jgi:hypothetical protein
MATLLSGVLLTACSVVGVRSGTEQPRYDVVAHLADGVEIRRYAPRLAAETTVDGTEVSARSTGFQRVAGYIFGGNARRDRIAMTAPIAVSAAPARDGERIAMTAPVAQTRTADGRWTIRFFLPASLAEADAPAPNDSRVRVAAVPAETMGVLRYTGSISPDAVAQARARLLAALSSSAWTPQGDAVSWFYDPPWTLPPLRRNEAAVPVAAAPAATPPAAAP